MIKMNRFRRIISTFIPVVILLSCVIGAFVYTGAASKSIPDNPLEQKANASHMLIPSNGNLSIKEDVTKQAKSAEINHANVEDVGNSEAGETEEGLVNDSDGTLVSGGSEIVTGSNGAADGNVDAVGFESNAEKNAELYGDEQQVSGKQTDKTYFVTTINDGETVHSRDYSFEIEHKHSELTVKSLNVYVNGSRQIQFKGNVLLEEGKNTIRVAVEYTDSDGRIIPVYRDYTVNVDLGDIIIYSDLTDKDIAEKAISFNASAKFDGKDVSVIVKCGDKVINGSGGRYTANLESGENIITVSAQSGSHQKSRSFKIVCTVQEEMLLYTDLSDMTVHNDIIEFSAYIINGSSKASLTVVANGKTVSGGRNYIVNLKAGSNVIRLKATDTVNGQLQTIYQSYVIKYMPETTEETAPSIKYINVSNGMNVRGTDFTLDIQAEDHGGSRIYQEGMTVQLNGTIYSYSWAGEYVSYRLWLESGVNTLVIRVTDKDGRYSDYSYNINCEAVSDGEQIGEITISIDAAVLGLGYIAEPIKVPVYQGINGAETVVKFLEDNGFTYSNSGELDESFYLSRIQKQGIASASRVSIPQDLVDEINADGLEWKSQKFEDSLGEHDYCQGSGWQYSINGVYSGFSMSDYYPKDGDVVRIRYTLAYGKDIGGCSTGGKNYDKTW